MTKHNETKRSFGTKPTDMNIVSFSELESPSTQTNTGSEPWPETLGEHPPQPSRSTRRIAKRSKHSSRGGVVIKLPAWTRPRIVLFESKLEQRALFMLLARGDVVDLWEQPPSITYRNQLGLRGTHFPDFLIKLRSGRRIAVAIKPAKVVEKKDFLGTLRCVRQAMTKDYADDLVLITDQDFTKAEALNAQRFHDFSRTCDPSTYGKLRDVISDTVFPTTVGALSAKLAAPGAGFRSVLIAIYEGLLSADRTTLIDLNTTVVAGGVK